MKLRLEATTLRLRLAEAEVAAFAATGQVVETVRFGPGQALRYALQRADTPTVAVRYAPGHITVLVPPALADAWTGTAQIGFAETIGPLRILVEKDLDCQH